MNDLATVNSSKPSAFLSPLESLNNDDRSQMKGTERCIPSDICRDITGEIINGQVQRL